MTTNQSSDDFEEAPMDANALHNIALAYLQRWRWYHGKLKKLLDSPHVLKLTGPITLQPTETAYTVPFQQYMYIRRPDQHKALIDQIEKISKQLQLVSKYIQSLHPNKSMPDNLRAYLMDYYVLEKARNTSLAFTLLMSNQYTKGSREGKLLTKDEYTLSSPDIKKQYELVYTSDWLDAYARREDANTATVLRMSHLNLDYIKIQQAQEAMLYK